MTSIRAFSEILLSYNDDESVQREFLGIITAESDQQRVFEKVPASRRHADRQAQGTGLGLTICREIVAYHGGQLMLDSQPGQGSTFTIVLPIARVERLAA